MASSRVVPYMIAGGVGIVGGYYVFNPSFQELSGKGPAPGPIKDGRSQSVQDDRHGTPSASSPLPSLRTGGASPVKNDGPTVAGTSPSSRAGYSADHDVEIRANPKEQDGTSGGGVGVAEMRERKMEGRGLPSPQGGDTPARPVQKQSPYNDGESVKQSVAQPEGGKPSEKSAVSKSSWFGARS